MLNVYLRSTAVWVVCALVAAATGWAEDVLPSLSFNDEAPAEAVAPGITAPAAAPAVTKSTPKAPSETTDAGDRDAVDVGTAREKAIAFFRSLAAAEGADGLIAPPARQRKVVGYTDVEVRFSEKLVDVPVFETVQEYQDVKVGESVDAVTIRKKVGVRKVVGTEKKMGLVKDPNGTIVRTLKERVYGPGGPDVWHGFQFGHNAMAIYAMMRAGVDPGDEIVQSVAEALSRIYEEFGLPDLTWDLAWSTAAFSLLREERYQELARQMAGKLLDGQIDNGNASGLWGPVCVNTELLAAMTRKKADYSAFYLAAKAKHAVSKRESDQKKADQALEALRTFDKLFRRVSMLAGKMTAVTRNVSFEEEMGILHPFSLPALPSWIFNQRSADMESTAIAMFGLRVAAGQKLIPTETWRPLDERKRPLARPRRAQDVLQRAVTAIQRAQRQEGWTELNQHQPVTDFDKIEGIKGVPVDGRSFAALDSKMTSLSTAQGYAVFSYYAALFGVSGLNPYARNVMAGNASVKAILAKGFGGPDPKALPACDLCFFLSDTPDLGNPEFDLKAWLPIAKYLVSAQNKDGSWGTTTRYGVKKEPSSLRERRNVLPGILEPKADKQLWSKAHVDFNVKTMNQPGWIPSYFADPRIELTAYALLALAGDKEQ